MNQCKWEMYISVNSRQVRVRVHGGVSFPKKRLTFRYQVRTKIEFCYRPGEMARLAECNCQRLVSLTPARLIVLQDERSNIFYYVQLGTCDLMVILGRLMLLRMQRFSPLPHYVVSSVLSSGLFLFLPWKQKQMGGESTEHLFHARFYGVLFPLKFAFVVVCGWNAPMLRCVYLKRPLGPGDKAKVGGDNSHR